ncbi:mismatch repair endonuclease PMS2 [Anabrus simplex]|uniref:mismatch repair endonuclease PMS2 n=1 Tax=Anabrus simplex TaxID=316456 RepID=UPI0035A3D364
MEGTDSIDNEGLSNDIVGVDENVKSLITRNIEPINKSAVHRICSGQVVLNLATAVKELVENSLDARATVIEIRLKEYGSELIEVIDNGCGVEEKNFEGLTLKYHTSKLRDFTDLYSVDTFGFRGEALSSLCALGELSIVTCHSNATCGTKLEYDNKGIIINQKPCARQIGTTVSLQNLFYTLPVRQKEFHRNLRREFGKMVQILYAYCLVSTGVKILCTNQVKKGARATVVSTQGSPTVKENIISVFGAKQVASLMEISQKSPSSEVLQELGISQNIACDENPFKLEGFVSSCAHGQGRSAGDRQFFYVNSRPCEPHKISKSVNEVYHHFNKHQYPFVFLNMRMAHGNVDVNLTPDKRQVFLDQEKLLIATVKASLLFLYESVPSTYKMQNVPVDSVPTAMASPGNLSALLKQWTHSSAVDSPPPSTPVSGRKKSIKRSLEVIRNESNKPPKQICVNNYFFNKIECKSESDSSKIKTEEILEELQVERADLFASDNQVSESNVFSETEEIVSDQNDTKDCKSIHDTSSPVKYEDKEVVSLDTMNFKSEVSNQVSDTHINKEEEKVVVVCDNAMLCNSDRFSVTIDLSIDRLCVLRNQRREQTTLNKNRENCDDLLIKFMTTIDPSKNTAAENELRREISKDMFAKMEIVGQFNLGFIITLLDSDLFIIDQHATDEIYNFETLQKTTVLQNQKLVIPQHLNLTYVNENILIENQDIFHKNGFEFIINESAEPTQRVQLTAIPMSKNWTFGKEDIDELLFMLQDAPHTMCRPSRVRAMFASRACRKSVMIGTALSYSDMRRLVNHMGEIDQPWNCPHGRPTMRHLVNMDFVYNRWKDRLNA